MNIEFQKIKYKNELPFGAELCHIVKQLPHRHEKELELVYCLEGSIHLIAADQDYTLRAGQIHSIDFKDIHFLESDEPNTTLLFHLNLESLPEWQQLEYVFFACESNHCFPYQEPAMEIVKDTVLSLSYSYFNGSFPNNEACNNALNKLTDTLLQYFNWFNYNNQDDYMNQALFDRFTRIIVYIYENYQEKISVSQLAAKEHINKNYFSQFISKTVFSSFSNMVKYIRCYEAEVLLLTTDMPISEISYECGFSDPKYFYSAFKDLWRATPTEHRQMYAKQYESALLELNRQKNKKSSSILSDKAAASVIKDFIVKWHLAKTFK